MTLAIIKQSDQDTANKLAEDAGFGQDTFTAVYTRGSDTFLVACGLFDTDLKAEFKDALSAISVEFHETKDPVQRLIDLGYDRLITNEGPE